MNAQVEDVVPGAAVDAPATTAVAAEAPAADSFDYADLAAHDEYATPEPEVSGKGVEPASASLASPASGDQTLPSTPPPPPVAPPIAAAPPPLPTTEPQPVQPPVQATEAGATAPLAEQLSPEQHREQFLPRLAEMYQLSEAEVEELRVNPGAALPKMAARLHYEVQMAAYNGVMHVLPHVIESQMRARATSDKYSEQFYSKWPALKSAVASDATKEQVILRAIGAHRQLNPQAPVDRVIAEAGLLAMMQLGIPVEIPGSVPAPATPPPVTPQPPGRPPGISAQGHIAPRLPPGQQPGDDIAALVAAFDAGEI